MINERFNNQSSVSHKFIFVYSNKNNILLCMNKMFTPQSKQNWWEIQSIIASLCDEHPRAALKTALLWGIEYASTFHLTPTVRTWSAPLGRPRCRHQHQRALAPVLYCVLIPMPRSLSRSNKQSPSAAAKLPRRNSVQVNRMMHTEIHTRSHILLGLGANSCRVASCLFDFCLASTCCCCWPLQHDHLSGDVRAREPATRSLFATHRTETLFTGRANERITPDVSQRRRREDVDISHAIKTIRIQFALNLATLSPPPQKQASVSKRRASRRPSSNATGAAGAAARDAAKEVPWDLFDRLIVPLVCCHAAAVLLAFVLNVLRISQVSSFALFIWFALLMVGSILFYHHLKVSALSVSSFKLQTSQILHVCCRYPLRAKWSCSPAASRRSPGCSSASWTTSASMCSPASRDVPATRTPTSWRRSAPAGWPCCSWTSRPSVRWVRWACIFLSRPLTLRFPALLANASRRPCTWNDRWSAFGQMLEASLHISEHLPEGAKGIWALVHCATWMALGELEWVPFQVLRKSVDINLLGAARLTQIMLPLIRRTGGRIVFLSSGGCAVVCVWKTVVELVYCFPRSSGTHSGTSSGCSVCHPGRLGGTGCLPAAGGSLARRRCVCGCGRRICGWYGVAERCVNAGAGECIGL